MFCDQDLNSTDVFTYCVHNSLLGTSISILLRYICWDEPVVIYIALVAEHSIISQLTNSNGNSLTKKPDKSRTQRLLAHCAKDSYRNHKC